MKTLVSSLAISLIMFAASLCAARPAPPDSLTVEQAVRLTVQNHPLIQQAACGIAAVDARADASRSPRYPDISLVGLYTRLDPVAEMEIAHMGSFRFYPENNYDFHVALRQTLYDFGRTGTGIALAESARRTASDYIEVVKSGLAYQAVVAFDAILILRRSIEVIGEQMGALQGHPEVARTKIEA
ncbi:MAG: TolC family protein, partial [Candidatus Krumholzibacteria bacterium]|nr:TolC family protein [Candidatus Krumholzibacteria bacterium]